MALREILAKFGIEFDTADAEKAEGAIEGLLSGVKKLAGELAGTAIAGGLVAMTREVANQADALYDQAEALGVSLRELQEWRWIGKAAGVEAGELNGALTKFTQTVLAAADSAKGPAAAAFKALGVSVKDASGELGRPLDLIEGVAVGLTEIEDPAKRMALAMTLFGKAGQKLAPLLAQGPAGIKKLREEIESLGGGFTTEFAEAAGVMNDNFDRLDFLLLSIKVRLSSFVLPALNSLLERAINIGKSFTKLADETDIVQSGLIAAGIAGAASVAKLIKRFGGLKKLLAGGFKVAFSFLVLDDLIGFLQGKDSLIGRAIDEIFGEGSQQKVRDFFREVRDGWVKFVQDSRSGTDEFRRNWNQALADAEKDFDKAFGETFSGILVAALDTFYVFLNGLSGGWTGFNRMMDALLAALLFNFEVVWSDIQYIVYSVAAGIADKFAAVWNGINAGGRATANFLQRILSAIPGMEDAAKAVGDSIRESFGMDMETSWGNVVDAWRADDQKRLFKRAEAIDTALRTPAAPQVTNNINLNGPTTPAAARQVGDAAGKSTSRSLKGTQAALVPKKG